MKSGFQLKDTFEMCFRSRMHAMHAFESKVMCLSFLKKKIGDVSSLFPIGIRFIQNSKFSQIYTMYLRYIHCTLYSAGVPKPLPAGHNVAREGF